MRAVRAPRTRTRLSVIAGWPQARARLTAGKFKVHRSRAPRGGAGRPGYSRGERPGSRSGQEHIRLDCTVNEQLVCIVYRDIIDLRFAVGGHYRPLEWAHDNKAYVRFNQTHVRRAFQCVRAKTPKVVCVRGQMKLRPSWLR